MNNQSIPFYRKSFKLFACFSSVFTILVGSLVLLGWQIDNYFLQSFSIQHKPMNPVMAVCFLFLGVSLLAHQSLFEAMRYTVARACAIAVCIVGICRLLFIYTGLSVNPDELLYISKLGSSHITPNMAFILVILSVSLLFLNSKRNLYRHFFVLLAAVISFMAIVSDVYDVQSLYQIPAYISMNMITALAFFILSCGILCNDSDYGIVRILTNEGISGELFRRLLFQTISILLVMGLVWINLSRFKYLDFELGILIFVVLLMVIFISLIWHVALVLEKIDIERQHLNVYQKAIVSNAGYAIISCDVNFKIKSFNPAAEKMLRYQAEHIIDRMSILELHDKNEIAKRAKEFSLELNEDVQEGVDVLTIKARKDLYNAYEWVFVRNDGSTLPVLLSITALRNAQNQIFGYLGIATDITEQKNNERELKKVNEDLKRLDGLKNDFVNNVSHELRTPLAIIKESIALVYDKIGGPITTMQQEFLEIAKSNVDRLARLINDVLDYQSLESKQIELKLTQENINDIVWDVGMNFRVPLLNRGLDLKLQLKEDLPAVRIDRDKIIQVLINFLNNAMKFTQRGTVYLITELEGNNAVRISVKDEGIGIKKKDFDKLFKSFSQISSNYVEGTGLGLVLCKMIIEKHNGKVGVISEFGKGSTFYFILPIENVSLEFNRNLLYKS